MVMEIDSEALRNASPVVKLEACANCQDHQWSTNHKLIYMCEFPNCKRTFSNESDWKRHKRQHGSGANGAFATCIVRSKYDMFRFTLEKRILELLPNAKVSVCEKPRLGSFEVEASVNEKSPVCFRFSKIDNKHWPNMDRLLDRLYRSVYLGVLEELELDLGASASTAQQIYTSALEKTGVKRKTEDEEKWKVQQPKIAASILASLCRERANAVDSERIFDLLEGQEQDVSLNYEMILLEMQRVGIKSEKPFNDHKPPSLTASFLSHPQTNTTSNVQKTTIPRRPRSNQKLKRPDSMEPKIDSARIKSTSNKLVSKHMSVTQSSSEARNGNSQRKIDRKTTDRKRFTGECKKEANEEKSIEIPKPRVLGHSQLVSSHVEEDMESDDAESCGYEDDFMFEQEEHDSDSFESERERKAVPVVEDDDNLSVVSEIASSVASDM